MSSGPGMSRPEWTGGMRSRSYTRWSEPPPRGAPKTPRLRRQCAMPPIRAIVYGVGAMGSIMARLLLEKGVEIVGAVGRSAEKIGRDLGDVAGLGFRTGIAVEPDARPALERGADIAVV